MRDGWRRAGRGGNEVKGVTREMEREMNGESRGRRIRDSWGSYELTKLIANKKCGGRQ